MSYTAKFAINAAGVVALTTTLLATAPAQASDTGAFVGGMLTSRVLGNMQQRTRAEQQQAQAAQQSAQQQQQVQQAPAAAPAASSTQSTEQKLDELNKLAAGGYITPDEYKAKKQAIIDAM